jgi:hypothetical protein
MFMRSRFALAALALVSFSAVACATVPAEAKSPDDDAGTTAQATKACHVLEAVSCPEATPDPRTAKSCVQRLTSEAKIAKVPFDCVIGAKTKEDVRGCGTKDTLRFRCRDGG